MLIAALLFIFLNPQVSAEVKNGTKLATPPGVQIAINTNDLRIIDRAEQILNHESKWNRKDNRECPEKAVTFSLYCALYKASVEVNGEFDHRLGALEEIRRSVENFSRGKNYEHRLMHFNNDPETKFADIRRVFKVTGERIKKRLEAKQAN